MLTLMKTYNYILLDWDGTLVNSLELWLSALKTALLGHGYSFADDVIGANYSIFRRKASLLGVENVDNIIRYAEGMFAGDTIQPTLYTGALDFIKNVHSSKQIAIVTTSTHSQVDTLLNKFGLSGYIDAVVCSDDVKKQKPDAEPLKMALNIIGGNMDESVMLGDSGIDIIAARSAGIDSILIHPDSHNKFYDVAALKELKPTHLVKTYYEAQKLILA